MKRPALGSAASLALLALAATVVAAASPAEGLAARAPEVKEARAIRAAIDTFMDRHPPGPSFEEKHRVRRIRVSTVDRRWARATVLLYIRGTDVVGEAPAAVLRKRLGKWRVRAVATDAYGCGVPEKVRADLKLPCGYSRVGP